MLKHVFYTICLFLSVQAFAQQPVGALTVFSEDGDKFYLILNGEKQNNIPLSNIRVEDLTQPYYAAKIIFEDKTLPEISKKNLMVADMDGIFMDVTYKIKHDKGGMPKLGALPYSSVPMQQGFVAPANVYVTHFGAPAPAPAVTQTTTTTVMTGTPNSASVNVNAMGINMNVNISDPMMNGTVRTTTTETTTVSGTNAPPRPVNPALKGCTSNYPMAPGNFASAVTTIKNQNFEDSKLSTAKQIAGSNCLSASQISDICRAFTYEDSKLDFAKFAYSKCTDPGNYFTVNNVFTYSSSTEALNEFIQTQH